MAADSALAADASPEGLVADASPEGLVADASPAKVRRRVLSYEFIRCELWTGFCRQKALTTKSLAGGCTNLVQMPPLSDLQSFDSTADAKRPLALICSVSQMRKLWCGLSIHGSLACRHCVLLDRRQSRTVRRQRKDRSKPSEAQT